MKNVATSFKKALTMLLAFAMVITSITVTSPVTVQAAAKKKIVKSVSVSPKSVTFTRGGETKTVKATVKATKSSAAKDLRVTVKSSNNSVATAKVAKNPSKKGKSGVSQIKITAKGAGSAKITVTAKNVNKKGKAVSKAINVTVQGSAPTPTTAPTTAPTAAPTEAPAAVVPPTSASQITIKLPENSTVLTEGDSQKLTVSFPEGVSTTITKWESSDPSIATIDNEGNITAKGAGTVKFTATTAEGLTQTVEITINKKAVAPTGVQLSSGEETLQVGDGLTLTHTLIPENASTEVTWASSNTEVATVNNGVVTAIGEGSADISVTTVNGGFKAVCKITVVSANTKEINISESIKQSAAVGDFRNTVMTGTVAEVTLTVKDKKNQPIANQNISISIKRGAGNAAGCKLMGTLNQNATYSELRTDESNVGNVTTDANGMAKINLNLVAADGSTLKPNSGILQSYLVTAKASEDIEYPFNVNFANMVLPYVMATGMVPTENAMPGDNGYYWTERDGIKVDYVTSQQVGNAVDFTAIPIVWVPKSAADSAANEVHITQKLKIANGKLVPMEGSFTSGEYSVYNGEGNEKTTVVVELPAGLKDAVFNFTNYEISQYTKLKINFKWADNMKQVRYANGTDVCVEKTGVVKNSKVQIKSLENVDLYGKTDQRMLAYITLESEGQVNLDSNGGYEFVDVLGHFKDGFTGGYEIVPIYDAVKWEIEDVATEVANPCPVNSTNITNYVKGLTVKDREFLTEAQKDNFNYEVRVPSYTMSTGNAIIKATHKNSSKLVYYYSYPTDKNNENRNVFADYTSEQMTSKSGISISGKAADVTKGAVGDGEYIKEKVLDENGQVTEFNTKIYSVYSDDAGVTGLKLTLESPLFGNIFSGNNKVVIHTSVHWDFNENSAEVEIPDKFYLLKGQEAKIKVHVYNTSGSSSNDAEKVAVTLTSNGEALLSGQTDAKGIYTFTITDANASAAAITTLEKVKVEEDTADKHIVDFFVVKPDGTEIKVGKSANLYWVTAGLYFKDQVDLDAVVDENGLLQPQINGTPYTSYTNDTTVRATLERTVGESWMTGVRILGDVNYASSGYIVSKINGLDAMFNVGGNPVEDANGQYVKNELVMKSTTATTQMLDTYFAPVDENNLSFEFVLDEYELENGVPVGLGRTFTVDSIGHGSPSLPAKMKFNVDWKAKTDNLQYGIILPQGDALATTANVASRTVYFTVKDQFGNPCASNVYVFVNGTAYAGLGEQDYKVDGATVSIGDTGVAAYTLPEMDQAGTVNVAIKLMKAASIDPEAKGSLTVYAPADIPQFALVSASLSGKEVTMKFSQPIGEKIAKAEYLAKLFSVADAGAAASYTIDSAEIVLGTDNKTVKLTLSTEPTAANIVASAIDYTVGNITYKLVSDKGASLANSTITFEKDKTYDVTVKQKNGALLVQIKSGGAVISNIGSNKIYLVDVDAEDDLNNQFLAVLSQTNYYAAEQAYKYYPCSATKNICAYYQGFDNSQIVTTE